jgi:hypothetical protein
VETGHLQFAVELHVFHRGIGHVQELVEVQEIVQHEGMDQQRRVDLSGSVSDRYCSSSISFSSSASGVRRRRRHIAHLLLHVDGFGERTQVQADDGAFQPACGWRR